MAKEREEEEKRKRKLARTNPLKLQFVTGPTEAERPAEFKKAEQENQMPTDPENSSSKKAVGALRARFMANRSTTASTPINAAPSATSALPPCPPPDTPVNAFTLNSTPSDQERYGIYIRRLRAKREGRVGEPDLTESQLKHLQMEHARLAKRKKAELARGGKPKPNRKMLTFKVDEDIASKMVHLVYWYGAKNQQHFLEGMLLQCIADMEDDIEKEKNSRLVTN